MTLIIEIPEEDHNRIKDNSPDAFNYLTSWRLYDAIKNGTPLPKGHGRLIDADALKTDAQTMTEWNGDVFRCVTERTIDYAPTIIEADRG